MKFKVFFILVFICHIFTVAQSRIIVSESNLEITITENITQSELEIKTYPENAEIYLNNSYKGTSNIILNDIATGEYKLLIKKEGFKNIEREINYQRNTKILVEAKMERAVGFLDLQGDLKDLEGTAGLYKIKKGINELPPAYYITKLRAFGYKDFKRKIKIEKDKTTILQVNLEKEDFVLSKLKINRKIFNPENPGKLGICTISFNTSSFGKGDLKIFNENNDLIISNKFPEFTKWNQNFKWNGKDQNNKKLQEGKYKVIIYGISPEDKKSRLESFITINYKSKMNYRTNWNGSRGFMFCPSPETLEKGSMEFSSLTMGHYEAGDFFAFPTTETISFSPINNIEASIFAGIEIKNENEIPVIAGLSIKYRFLNSNFFQSAVISKFTYKSHKEENNVFTNDSGFTIGTPLSFKTGFMGFIIMPEISITNWQENYNEEITKEEAYIWINTRAAVYADFKHFSTGISASTKKGNLYSSDSETVYPHAAAVEFNILIPDTSIYITCSAGSEFRNTDDYYIMAGFGFGFIY